MDVVFLLCVCYVLLRVSTRFTWKTICINSSPHDPRSHGLAAFMREVSNSSFSSCGKPFFIFFSFSGPFYWFPVLLTAAECVHHVLLCIVGEPLSHYCLAVNPYPPTPPPSSQPGSLCLAHGAEVGSVSRAHAHTQAYVHSCSVLARAGRCGTAFRPGLETDAGEKLRQGRGTLPGSSGPFSDHSYDSFDSLPFDSSFDSSSDHSSLDSSDSLFSDFFLLLTAATLLLTLLLPLPVFESGEQTLGRSGRE